MFERIKIKINGNIIFVNKVPPSPTRFVEVSKAQVRKDRKTALDFKYFPNK